MVIYRSLLVDFLIDGCCMPFSNHLCSSVLSFASCSGTELFSLYPEHAVTACASLAGRHWISPRWFPGPRACAIMSAARHVDVRFPVPSCDSNSISGAPESGTAAREAVDITDIVASTGWNSLQPPAHMPGQQSWPGTAASSAGAGAAGAG